MGVDGPEKIKKLLEESCEAWQHKKAGKTLGLAAADGLELKVVREENAGKTTTDQEPLEPQECSYLRSCLCGGQWPQQRLFAAGYVDSALCTWCRAAPGTLWHRHFVRGEGGPRRLH